jgi:hypothetical protein
MYKVTKEKMKQLLQNESVPGSFLGDDHKATSEVGTEIMRLAYIKSSSIKKPEFEFDANHD